MNQYCRITTDEPQPHVKHITMVAMVPLLTPISGYYTTFYNHIAIVLTPMRDPGKTIVEPHFILQGYYCSGEIYGWWDRRNIGEVRNCDTL